MPVLARFMPGVKLVPFAERHFTPRYVGWLNDPGIVRYSEQRHRKHTLVDCREFVLSVDYMWAVEAGLLRRHVGNLSAMVDWPNKVADLSILIGERGQGYGLEAWKQACEFLFRQRGMRKITAGCMVGNDAMMRILRKTMTEEGVRRRQFILDDEEVDCVQFGVFG